MTASESTYGLVYSLEITKSAKRKKKREKKKTLAQFFLKKISYITLIQEIYDRFLGKKM